MVMKAKESFKMRYPNNIAINSYYVEGFQDGYNKAKEEIRKELLELKADSFDTGMFLRVGETLRKLGIKED